METYYEPRLGFHTVNTSSHILRKLKLMADSEGSESLTFKSGRILQPHNFLAFSVATNREPTSSPSLPSL